MRTDFWVSCRGDKVSSKGWGRSPDGHRRYTGANGWTVRSGERGWDVVNAEGVVVDEYAPAWPAAAVERCDLLALGLGGD